VEIPENICNVVALHSNKMAAQPVKAHTFIFLLLSSACFTIDLIKNYFPVPPGPVINKFSPLTYFSKQICCSTLSIDIINNI
jgi:hypothetical protein